MRVEHREDDTRAEYHGAVQDQERRLVLLELAAPAGGHLGDAAREFDVRFELERGAGLWCGERGTGHGERGTCR